MLRRIEMSLVLLMVWSTIDAGNARKERGHTVGPSRRGHGSDEESALSQTEEIESDETETGSAPSSPKEEEDTEDEGKMKRVCDPCPEDRKLHWRDPRVLWICGAYQRARRSFKSLCMMHYRNCQDGTMFVKIHDHRCKNDTYHGDHFFYDYRNN